jgi:hypothetical protein
VNRRGAIAGAVLLCWGAGLGLLVKREYFRPAVERLSEAALRVTPGAVFYAVMQRDRQIGFASSTIDTTTNAIRMEDYLVADLPVGGRMHRATARADVQLTRALRVSRFTVSLESDAAPVRATGVIEGDSILVLAVGRDERAPVDTQHIRLSGPILLPTLVPLAIALGDEPEVGKRYDLPMFDPLAMKPLQVTFRIDAESSFVVHDSAGFDASSKRWRPMLPATVRAWHVRSEGTDGGAAAFSGWIDEQGRVVATSQLGFDVRRRPYELAFENWRLDTRDRGDAVDDDRDILESTAIAAGKHVHGAMPELRVRLTNVDLAGYDLDGGRQRLRGDTLTIQREGGAKLDASYTLPVTDRGLYRYLRPEPLLQTRDPGIARVARQLKDHERDPRAVAARIAAWVHDSLKKEITFGVPDAAAVLRARRGDCNEHTQLYVALARAAGIPTRIAAGLAYIDGKFYYHAWPEVYLNDWVAVDPTFGQFPADAAHLRFTIGGLGRQTRLLRLMGNLRIDVLR